MNKRILSILLGLVLVASLLVMAVPVSASTSTEVKLLPDKTEANPGDTITYTLSLGPCDEVGGFEFRYIFPEGLEYVPGSGKVVSGAKEAMHFGTLDWTQKSMLLNGTTALESEEYYDYKSDSDTALMTFDVKVADDASGDLTVTFKEGYPNTWIQNWTTEKTHDLTYTTQAVTIGGSAEPTEAPAEPTEAPAEPTEAPAEPTEAPAEPTEAPAEPTEAPAEPTEAPHVHDIVFVPEVPATTTTPGVAAHYQCTGCDKLFSDATGNVEVTAEDLVIPVIQPTEAPAEPTEAPAEPTDAPAEPTEAPAAPTEAPAEPTEAPAEPTEAPAEPTEAPAEPTEAPAEPTEAPAEPTEAPVVEPTIDPAAPTEAATEAAGQDATVAPTQAATSAATKDTATKTTTSPKTGDATHMTLWMFIMIASLVGVAVVLYAAKRKGIFTK